MVRCKLCNKVKNGGTGKNHCWQSQQQCPNCHYFGIAPMQLKLKL